MLLRAVTEVELDRSLRFSGNPQSQPIPTYLLPGHLGPNHTSKAQSLAREGLTGDLLKGQKGDHFAPIVIGGKARCPTVSDKIRSALPYERSLFPWNC